jgi:hypothetical protein
MSFRLHSTRARWVSASDSMLGRGLHTASMEVENACKWLHLVSHRRMDVRDIQWLAEGSHGTDPSTLSDMVCRNVHGAASL